MVDYEINALAECTNALNKLEDNEAKVRVLQYLISRFNIMPANKINIATTYQSSSNNYSNNLLSEGQEAVDEVKFTPTVNMDYPILSDVVTKDLPQTEIEWVLIYCFYASNFGKSQFHKEQATDAYKQSKRYSETNRKNYSANFQKCIKNNWIKGVNEEEYIVKDEGKEYANKILQGNSSSKARIRTQRKKNKKINE